MNGIVIKLIKSGAFACLFAACPAGAQEVSPKVAPAPNASPRSAMDAPPRPDVDRARELYIEGSELVEAGRWQPALEAYERALALYPSPSTLFNMAYCHSQLGHLVDAWLLSRKALALSEVEEGRHLGSERRAAVEEERDRLRARLAGVVLAGRGSIRVSVRDAKIVQTEGEVGTYHLERSPGQPQVWAEVPAGSRLLLDPGAHRLSWRQGERLEERVLDLAEGRVVTIEVVEAQATGADGVAAGAASSAASSAAHGASASGRERGSAGHAHEAHLALARAQDGSPSAAAKAHPYRVLGVGALVLGGASLAMAAVSLGIVVDADSKLSATCMPDGTCPQDAGGLVSRYETAALATNVGLIVGTAASALGVGLLWLGAAHERGSLAVQITPTTVRLGVAF